MEKLLTRISSRFAVSIFLTITILSTALATASGAIAGRTDATIHVAITQDGFDPKISTVKAGTTVVWTNLTAASVSLNAGDIYQIFMPIVGAGGDFDLAQAVDVDPDGSPVYVLHTHWMEAFALGPGESFSYTFTTTGEYPLTAESIQSMRSVIFVDSETPDQSSSIATATPAPTESASATPAAPTQTATPVSIGTAPPTSTPAATPVPTQQFIVSLETDPADGLNFDFTLNSDQPFTLDDADIDDKDGVSNSRSFNNLAEGQATVSLNGDQGYLIDAISCTSNQVGGGVSVSGGTVTTVLRTSETVSCHFVMLRDLDGDRLADVFETDNGVFESATSTGTSPTNADTDADGISDGDEVLGTLDGLNLPAMGTNPVRRTLLIEFDWYEDSKINKGYCGNGENGHHSHRPTAAVVAQIAAVFAEAPTPNPDGSTGIDIIQDYGQGGLFNGGNLIARNSTGLVAGTVFGPNFASLKAANFNSNRLGYFHYVVMAHQYRSETNFSSGQAEINGDDLIISIYNFNCVDGIVGQTIVHELGHNLGLHHGGHNHVNNKPNYNSVMNYRFQFIGVDADDSCDGYGDGINDYSDGSRISLDENNLDEAEGVCGAGMGSVNWNSDGDFDDVGIAADVNTDSVMSVLHDHDDWGSLYFFGINSAFGSRSMNLEHIRPVEISSEQAIPDFGQGAVVPDSLFTSANRPQ